MMSRGSCRAAAAGARDGETTRRMAGATTPESWGEEHATTTDRLFELLMTQQADGSFRLSPVLQQWLGQRWPAVKAAAEHHGEALVATAVVVALLAQEAADRADEWVPQ